jgi:hypothetical protein
MALGLGGLYAWSWLARSAFLEVVAVVHRDVRVPLRSVVSRRRWRWLHHPTRRDRGHHDEEQ